MTAARDDTHYDADETVAAKRVPKARPVAKRDTDYKSRVKAIKDRFPRILARLAE